MVPLFQFGTVAGPCSGSGLACMVWTGGGAQQFCLEFTRISLEVSSAVARANLCSESVPVPGGRQQPAGSRILAWL